MFMMLAMVRDLARGRPADADDAGRGLVTYVEESQLMLMMLAMVL